MPDLISGESPQPDLSRFAELNPEARLVDTEETWTVESPWGDDSLAIRVNKEARELIEALNDLRLPPRFTALWHQKSHDLEFIFGPVNKESDVRGRSFSFAFGGKDFLCEYADASPHIALLAQAARPAQPPSDSNYRNLTTLRSFLRVQRTFPDRPMAKNLVLTSFWVRNAEVDESDAVTLARHLNFYMHYFDRASPKIVLHPEPSIASEVAKPTRYPFGTFPASIVGKQLDPYLLGLWDSSMESADSYRHFLYSYQILEYAAFYFMREEIFQAIRRIALAPDVPSRIDDAARQMMDVVVDDRTSDEAKMVAVIQQSVDPTSIWTEIERHIGFFCEETRFDGGFTMPPLLKKGWQLDDFRTAWIPKLPDAFRKLRNALVHAREQRMARTIAPTLHNQHLLRPWANLVTSVAMQIILYRS